MCQKEYDFNGLLQLDVFIASLNMNGCFIDCKYVDYFGKKAMKRDGKNSKSYRVEIELKSYRILKLLDINDCVK